MLYIWFNKYYQKKKQVIYTYLEALSMLFKNLFPPILGSSLSSTSQAT